MIRPGSTKATNNTDKYLQLKIKLRVDALENKEKNVLDCFAGDSIIWSEVKKRINFDFKRFTIDADSRFKTDYTGNALTYLKTNNIQNYDVIDLDSWGSPIKYLEYIFTTNFKGVVICTFCSPVSLNPDKILAKISFGKIYENTNKKSILAKNIGSMFEQYLVSKGIKEYKGLLDKKRIYCSFIIK